MPEKMCMQQDSILFRYLFFIEFLKIVELLKTLYKISSFLVEFM